VLVTKMLEREGEDAPPEKSDKLRCQAHGDCTNLWESARLVAPSPTSSSCYDSFPSQSSII
jgi:hypothetical protein